RPSSASTSSAPSSASSPGIWPAAGRKPTVAGTMRWANGVSSSASSSSPCSHSAGCSDYLPASSAAWSLCWAPDPTAPGRGSGGAAAEPALQRGHRIGDDEAEVMVEREHRLIVRGRVRLHPFRRGGRRDGGQLPQVRDLECASDSPPPMSPVDQGVLLDDHLRVMRGDHDLRVPDGQIHDECHRAHEHPSLYVPPLLMAADGVRVGGLSDPGEVTGGHVLVHLRSQPSPGIEVLLVAGTDP